MTLADRINAAWCARCDAQAETIAALQAEVVRLKTELEKVLRDNDMQLTLRLDAEIAASKIGWHLQKERARAERAETAIAAKGGK